MATPPSADVRVGLVAGDLFIRAPRARAASVVVVPAASQPYQFQARPLVNGQGLSAGAALVRVRQQSWPQTEIIETLLEFEQYEDAQKAWRSVEDALVGQEQAQQPEAATGARTIHRSVSRAGVFALGLALFLLIGGFAAGLLLGHRPDQGNPAPIDEPRTNTPATPTAITAQPAPDARALTQGDVFIQDAQTPRNNH